MSRVDAGSSRVAVAIAGLTSGLLLDPDEGAAALQTARFVRGLFAVDGVAVLRSVRGGMIRTGATGLGVAEAVDLETGEHAGPGVDAAAGVDDGVVSVRPGRGDRDSGWAVSAASAGFARVTAVRLQPPEGLLIGAMELYERDAATPPPDRGTLLALAAQLGAVMASRLRCEQLQRAVPSRHRIGMAQGMLIERYGMDPGSAFEVLKRCSQDRGIKLLSVADGLVSTRRLPTAAPTRPPARSAAPAARAAAPATPASD